MSYPISWADPFHYGTAASWPAKSNPAAWLRESLRRLCDASFKRCYHRDGLGSTIALTDSEGQVRTRYAYASFGETTVTGDPDGNPFQYTGRENDGTGLYYYRARYYDPRLSRFISEDPIQFAGGINYYAFVLNDPINMYDPTGLWCMIRSSDPYQGRDPVKEWEEVTPDRTEYWNAMFAYTVYQSLKVVASTLGRPKMAPEARI